MRDRTPDVGAEDRAGAANGRNRWALIVGIDAYTKISALDGCVNDAKLWSSILIDHFGFLPENVRILLDRDATRTGILEGMAWLLANAGQDDVVVFTYSGHGSQMTDREGDDPDGWDETLVPIDSGRDPDPNRDISDDEIHLWLTRVGEKTPNITLLFDCCHSATASRDVAGKERRAPIDGRPASALPPSPIPAGARGVTSGARGGSQWLPLSERYVLLAGCRDAESSYEHTGDDGNTHGALTYFLSREILRAAPGATYRDVMERAAPRVTAVKPRQHPQLEGAWAREVFGARMRPPEPYFLVTKRTGKTVILSGGAAHGVTVGSELTVCDADVARLEDAASPAGRVRVTRARSVDCDADILEESANGAVTAGKRAFETLHDHGEMRLAVQVIAADAARRAAMETAVGGCALARVVDSEHSDAVRVMLLGPRATVGPEDPAADEGPLAEPSWVVAGSDGTLVMRSRRDTDAAIREVVSNLEQLARYRNALAISNPDAESKLAGKIDFLLRRKGPDDKWVPAEPDRATGEVVLDEGDMLGMEITSRHHKTVYVSVLDFGLSGSISLLHPPEGASEQLEPGVTFSVGMREGDTLEMYFPDTLPAAVLRGTEVFKLLATEVPADFRPLVQGGMRGEGRDPRSVSPLETLLDLATTDVGTRDGKRTRIGPSDWTTVERTITLRRRPA